MNSIGEMVAALALIVLAMAILAGGIGAACYAIPTYRVWEQGKSGEAELAKAEQNRQIRIEEAQAKKEAAVFEAEAEEIRAQGVANANEIIGESLKGNDAYLHYLWINGLHDGSSETIYIPTEANLPILEAGRKFGIVPTPTKAPVPAAVP